MAACGDVPPDDEPPRRSIDAGANALTEAAESLTSVPARTNDQECATLPHVPVPGEEPKEAAAHWYRDTATGYRRGRWYDYLLPVTAVLVTGAVITGGLRIGSDFLHRSDGVCHDTWRPTPSKDEVVGLTDGHCLLSESRALRVVEKTIAAQNDQVRKIRHEQPPAMIGSYRRNRVSVSASRLLRGEISSYESACENRRLAVVGSDEETRFISDGTIDVSAYPAVRFYNAAFSDLAYERTGVTKEFADHYREQSESPRTTVGRPTRTTPSAPCPWPSTRPTSGTRRSTPKSWRPT